MSSFTYNNNNTFTAPAHTGNVQVEVWGAGGGGGSNNRTGNNGSGGGGGGAYARSNVALTTGTGYTLVVGAGGAGGNNNNNGTGGGTSSFNTTTVVALGGGGGNSNGTGGFAALASGGTGQVGFNGGNGAGKGVDIGGGAGAGAGNANVGANGSSATGSAGGVGANGGGSGGAGGASNASGSNGIPPGGGGGGAGNNVSGTAKHGGTGAIGQVTLGWTPAAVFMEDGTGATQDFSIFTSPSNGSGAGFTGTAGTGTLTSSTQSVLSSVRSVNISTGASNGSAGVYTVSVMADAGRRVSFGFRFHGTPAPGLNGSSQQTAGAGFCGVDNNGAQAVTYYLGLTSGFKLVLMDGLGLQLAIGTTVLSADTDYRISFGYTLTSLTVNSYTAYINGVSELTATNVTINGAVGNDTLAFDTGDTGWTAGSNLTFYISNVYVDSGQNSDGEVGNVRVTAKLPFANGTTNGFTGSGTPSGYGSGNAEYVNYRPIQTLTANVNVVGAGSAVTEEYDIEGVTAGDHSLTGATILGYLGWLYAKSLSSETGQMILNGSNTNVSLTSTTAMFVNTVPSTTYPAGTGSDIGIITTTAVTTVTLYDAGVLVAYIPSAGTVVKHFLTLLGVGS